MATATLLAYADDETFALLAGGILALAGGALYYGPLVSVDSLGRNIGGKLLLAACPVLCLLLLWPVLLYLAAADVRNDLEYLFLFLVVGGAWMSGMTLLMPLLGLSVRDDAIEAGNGAAAVVVCGALLGVTLVFAGANIGEGPTIWTTIQPAFAATVVFLLTWLAVESTVHPSEAITLDRDMASALRLAGLLVACGLVLGRAAAGDWISAPRMYGDLAAHGWPVPVLGAAAIAAHRMLAPTPKNPRPSPGTAGLLPALAFVVAAAAWLLALGRP
jgi:uncharacterized membrane protein YjfL (UPF0719 family)